MAKAKKSITPTNTNTNPNPQPQKEAEEKKQHQKIRRYQALTEQYKLINFKGQTLYLDQEFYRFKRLTSDAFARLAYEVHPGALIQQIRELEHMVRAQAPDVSHLAQRVALDADTDWDMRSLSRVEPDESTVFRMEVGPNKDTKAASEFMLQLANGDPDLADDMVQAVAPLFMARKPAGVIWFVGTGANGKSALINAIYKIMGHHLASLTVAAIEDGRDAPRLNGMMGNVCRESSESRVDDTERYKAIGTHEPFDVHKFHSQDMITITGDLHHIFNANNIPVFGDKTQGARRRTLIVPFPARFADDPTFEDRTFTPEFLGGLLELVLEATHTIRDNGYQYRFSEATQQAKQAYDSEVNSAEAFLQHLRANRVEAFTNYAMLKLAYEAWCSAEGLIPLGVTNLKRVMETQARVERKSVRVGEKVTKWHIFGDSTTPPSEMISPDRLGLHLRPPTKEQKMVDTLEQAELSSEKEWWG